MKNLLVITLLFTSFGFGSVFDQTLDVSTLKCIRGETTAEGIGDAFYLRINEKTKELKLNMLEKVKYTGTTDYSIEAMVGNKKVTLLLSSLLLRTEVFGDNDNVLMTKQYSCKII